MGWLGGVDLVQAVARDARQGQTSESSGSTTRRPSVPCPSTIGTGSTCSHGQREESSSLACQGGFARRGFVHAFKTLRPAQCGQTSYTRCGSTNCGRQGRWVRKEITPIARTKCLMQQLQQIWSFRLKKTGGGSAACGRHHGLWCSSERQHGQRSLAPMRRKQEEKLLRPRFRSSRLMPSKAIGVHRHELLGAQHATCRI